MLRLDTQFEVHNLRNTKLFKVVTLSEFIEKGMATCAGVAHFDDLMLWVDNVSDAIHQLLSLPVGGLLFATSLSPMNAFSGTQLFSPKDPRVVQPGDVIVVSTGSPVVRVLYRRGSNSNLLFMTDRCNSLCLMCSQPPKNIDDAWHVEENLRVMDLIDPGEEQLGISGGEPTLYREGLLEILRKAKKQLPEKSLHLLSNGRLLNDSTWIEDLRRVDHPQLTWGVPLYADNAYDHDHVVQAPGAFSETIQGIYNLARANQRIEIRVVLSRLTTRRLPELAHFIFRNMPFVEHVALMGIENMGLAKKHYEELWIDPMDYQEELGQAAHFLNARGMNVSVYNLPLCVLKPSLLSFYRQSISDWKNLFIDTCQSCAGVERCAGFFKSHTVRWQSRGIRSITTEELAEYTRRAS
ncbi:His-Xaa-Ser system radical SAM maturase HxsC [Vreelandella malpeensis]|uniref:His-Xaa-Ser system radical SAM maturase HxsC n=1 Tax=Vreelandella malpeensis TaxID=1172368 RepID=A0ABS8DSL8_9GAMM|nr:His-Xaa-Ser system radical SAM maturase HxsC [Halomonas malpeensis]MCB8889236.1 His-Xaa-Ser system radical SAM maturase HxsC [Halomonas malpeensis]